jgi:hypothetical protein
MLIEPFRPWSFLHSHRFSSPPPQFKYRRNFLPRCATEGECAASTQPSNRKLAQKFADQYEAASRVRMTEVQVRRVCPTVTGMHSGAALSSTSTREFPR